MRTVNLDESAKFPRLTSYACFLRSYTMSIETSETAQAPAIFDSLPYYDNDLERDPSLKERAEKLIAREVQSSTTFHPRVPPPIELFSVCAPR